MTVAHSLGSEGPDIELLIFAGALLVLAVMLQVQKAAKLAVVVAVVAVAVALGTGSYFLGGEPPTDAAPPDVSVSIIEPENNDEVAAGEPVELRVSLEGGTLTDSTTAGDSTEGHIHVWVDGELASMPSALKPKVRLEPGRHEIAVEFVKADHGQFSPRIMDQIVVRAT